LGAPADPRERHTGLGFSNPYDPNNA
jgi:hypothetical protein